MKNLLLLLAVALVGCSPAEEVDLCDPEVDLGKADCDDGDPATVDRCVEVGARWACVVAPGECDHLDPLGAIEAACEDGDPCTSERCSPSDECSYSAPHCP